MAFKSMVDYNEQRYGNLFMLQNDGDSAQVIIMFRDLNDVLVAKTHYLMSDDFSGYVHCHEKDCPLCRLAKEKPGFRAQNRLFIPVYNIDADEIQYFDRSDSFFPQLQSEVFRKYENPSECIFQIIRHGKYRDRNTRYEFRLLGRNNFLPYDEILKKFNTSMPEDYSRVVRDMSPAEIEAALSDYLNGSYSNSGSSYQSAEDLPKYTPTPRVTAPKVDNAYEPPKVDIPQANDDDLSEIDDNVEF